MIAFTAPWLLAALAALPVVWWLLRITPPAPRTQDFPAIALLLGLTAAQSTPARTPWWLLLLRLVATALLITGFAGPVQRAPRAAGSDRPMLVVIDNGWASAPDWAERLRAVNRAAANIAPAAPIRLLTTAPDPDGSPLAVGPQINAEDLAARLEILRPLPWQPDRAAAAAVLAALPAGIHVVYVSDGVGTDAGGDRRFAAALRRFQSVDELRGDRAAQLLRPPLPGPDQLAVQAETLPGHAGHAALRALDSTGQTLVETDLRFGADGAASAALVLPPSLRNRIAALRIGGQTSAGAIALLDEGAKRRPVGVLARGSGQNEPLTGSLYYIRRALGRTADLRSGTLRQILKEGVSAIVLADETIGNPAEQAALITWVRRGGVLIRFAGPDLAGQTAADPLLPVTLLAGDRALGGAMSWSKPAALAAFSARSPFAGLTVPDDVRVNRQVLAQPGDAPDRPGREDWATLADGTPLVTAAPLDAGRLVLFHVTANADWSNLPLSGLFPLMLKRLVSLSAGVKTHPGDAPLVPRRALDGFGQLITPGPAARPIAAADLTTKRATPAHPPGLYGPDDATRAFNLGAAEPRLAALPPIPGAAEASLNGAPARQSFGPDLIAAGVTLLAADLIIALGLRGLLTASAALLVMLGGTAHAQRVPQLPSLATHLAFVITNDGQADGIAYAGLRGLSDFVNERTSAVLAEPVGVDPAHDDLSFYPLLYWPILGSTAVPDGATLARLNSYMEDGGIIVLDTRDAGAPDKAADDALKRIGTALSLPALVPLSPDHVLSHTFYLLRSYPGRWTGGTVWVSNGAERSNDGVSPVILGSNDWASSWATDAAGNPQYELTPGGEDQRILAYRFGLNLVIYALTGNYKADQVHVPELLRRMGEQAGETAPDASSSDGSPP